MLKRALPVLFGLLFCANAKGQGLVIKGSIRDSLVLEGRLAPYTQWLGLAFLAKPGAGVYQTQTTPRALYLVKKYELGLYTYDLNRQTLYTDFGSYRLPSEAPGQPKFSLQGRVVELDSSGGVSKVARTDSGLAYTLFATRMYVKSRPKVRLYEVEVQNDLRPGLRGASLFIPNLAYGTTVFAGPLGIDVQELALFNSYEFVRLNLPIRIERPTFSLSQNIGWGYADGRLKATTQAWRKYQSLQVGLKLKTDLDEANNYFYDDAISPDAPIRNLFLNRFDRVAELGMCLRNPRLWATIEGGYRRRRAYFDANGLDHGAYLRASWELPLAGAYANYSNGKHLPIARQHYAKVSAFAYAAGGQRFITVRPVYYLATRPQAVWQGRLIVEGQWTGGHLPTALLPTIAGNGIEFNTVADAALETLTPTSLAARRQLGAHFTLQKRVSISPDVPYEPSLFLATNGVWAAESFSLLDRQNPASIGHTALAEVGVGVRNLFIFPLPGLRPAVGFGYFWGFYPAELKALKASSLKFTLRFFN